MAVSVAAKHTFRIITPFLLFDAFLFLLLVSLSLPVAHKIYLLEIESKIPPNQPITSIGTVAKFGLWGYCISGYQFKDGQAYWAEDFLCSPPKVGYDIDPVLIRVLDQKAPGAAGAAANVLLKTIPPLLILHPIACFQTLLTTIPTFMRLFRLKIAAPGFVSIATLVTAILPAIFSLIVFIADLVLVIVARNRLAALLPGTLFLHWGPAVWLTGAATICLWVGVAGLAIYVNGWCGIHNRKVNWKKLRYHDEKSTGSASETDGVDMQALPGHGKEETAMSQKENGHSAEPSV